MPRKKRTLGAITEQERDALLACIGFEDEDEPRDEQLKRTDRARGTRRAADKEH